MIFLEVDDLLRIARRVLGRDPDVRDAGLLSAACARPRATVGGVDAYPTVHGKAAALVHSLARTRGLVDGNKRLALAALITFYGLQGLRLTWTNEQAYDCVIRVATGDLDEARAIAPLLERSTQPWAEDGR